MRITAAVAVAVLVGLPAAFGCSIQHRTLESTTSSAADTPESKGTTTTKISRQADQDHGVFDKTAHAIGDVVLFPFRALGEELGQQG